MKSLNRTLSLVLVFVMVLGMFGIASAAKLGDFEDKDKITYTEAVDYLTAAGIVAGDTATTINPTGDLTREQAAKLIAYAMLGQVAADNLRASAAPFSDVAADRWSAGYIAYCQKQGVINGLGDGSFAPTEKVTGYQYAKMLLCAIGFGVNGEFTGAGWELETARLALSYGIFAGNTKGASNTPANREEAFLYTFNTLSSLRAVSYNKNLGVYYVPGAGALDTNPVSTNAFRNNTVGAINFGMTLSATSNGAYGQARHLWQKNGVNATGKYSDAPVATLATSNNGTSLTALTSKSSAKYIKFSPDTSPAVTYYYNGADVTNDKAVALGGTATVATAAGGYVLLSDGIIYHAITAITVGATYTVSANFVATVTVDGARGTVGLIVNFIDTDSDSAYDAITFTHKTSLQLAAAPVVKTTGALTQVTIAGIGTLDADDIEYPAGLVKGDVVLYYVSGGTTYLEKADVITGKLTAFTAAAGTNPDSVTIGSTKYAVSGLVNQNASAAMTGNGLYNATKGVENVAFYLDNSGAVCYFYTTANVTMANTMYVAVAAPDTDVFNNTVYKAKALFGDGTGKEITVSKVAAYNGTLTAVTGVAGIADGKLAPNLFYTYAVNSDGTYNLTAVNGSASATAYQANFGVATTSAAAAITTIAGYKGLGDLGAANASSYLTITNGKANFLTETKNTAAAAWGTAATKDIIANASTIFAVYNGTTKTYDLYMGIANVPTLNVFPMGLAASRVTFPVSVLMNSSGTAASLVIVNANNEKDSTTAKGDYIFALGAPSKTTDGTNEYFTLNALVNGTPGTVKLDATQAAQVIVGSGFWKVTTKDANGIITGTTNTSTLGTHVTGVKRITAENNILCTYDNVTGGALVGTGLLSSSTACYVMNTTNGTFEKVDASALGLEIYGKTAFVDWVDTSSDDDTVTIVIATIS